MPENNQSKEHDNISWVLPTLIIVFVFLIFMGFIVRETPKHKFEISVLEMKDQLLLPQENTISFKKAASIIKTENPDYRFIDLRTPHDYLKGHITKAINIPIHRILDEEYKEILNPVDGTTNILYYHEHSGACTPWMLLYQMGYRNNKIMIGGYQTVKKNIIDRNNVQGVKPNDEVAKYDFAEIVSKTKGTTIPKTTPSQAPPKIKKKKKKSVEGGC